MAKKFLLKLKMIVSINFLANLPLGVIEIAVKPMLLSVGYKAVSEANKLFNFLLINIHLNSIP